jgi:hypothetical protein
MNVRLLSISISIVLLFLSAVATTPASAADPQNADKIVSGEKSDAGDLSGKLFSAPGETPEPVSAAQKEFADSLIAALKSKDTSRLRAMVASQSLQCFDKSRQPYLDAWFSRQFRVPIGKDYRLAVAKLAPEVSQKSTKATFPLAPSHVLIISYPGADSRRRSYSRLIGQQDNRWRLILGCPTDATIQKFNRSQLIRAKAIERAEKLLPKVKEPLASQIRAMVAKGDRMGAAKLCAEELHTDLLAAREVVARVTGEDNH